MAFSKKSGEGEAERLEVLKRIYPRARALFLEMKKTLPGRSAAPDDLLDALAAAVTGLLGGNELKTLPEPPERDAHDLPMEMVYFVPDS